MRPCVTIEYKRKFKTVGDVEPTDIKGALEDYLPASMKSPAVQQYDPC